jgi:DDE superfamily endonuclease
VAARWACVGRRVGSAAGVQRHDANTTSGTEGCHAGTGVGLYLDPPDGAIVLSVDEKTQIQALDRTQPTLPIKRGKAARMTHDDKRNGTTSLYAALEIATGEVTGSCYARHTHHEFLAFLNRLVKAYPRRPSHVVLDNSSTHSTPEVNRWLERHPRVHFHVTPTSASWMNMIEIWFSILTKQQVRRGVYHNVPELIAAIEHFIDGYNQRARAVRLDQDRRSSPREGDQTTRHFRNAALARRLQAPDARCGDEQYQPPPGLRALLWRRRGHPEIRDHGQGRLPVTPRDPSGSTISAVMVVLGKQIGDSAGTPTGLMEGRLGFCSAAWRLSSRRAERLGGSRGYPGRDPDGDRCGDRRALRDPSVGCHRLWLEHDPRGDSAGFDVGDRLVYLVERSRFADHARFAGGVKLEHLA